VVNRKNIAIEETVLVVYVLEKFSLMVFYSRCWLDVQVAGVRVGTEL
jgi:hypothetical protein